MMTKVIFVFLFLVASAGCSQVASKDVETCKP